jgi:hypothetical protein
MWAHLVASTLIDELREHGVHATVVRIAIGDLRDSAP